MTVGEISNEAVSTAADDTVLAAAEQMDAEGIGVLVVEDMAQSRESSPIVKSRSPSLSTRAMCRISPSTW